MKFNKRKIMKEYIQLKTILVLVFTFSILTGNIFAEYCNCSATNTADEWITKVTIGDFQNSSGSDGYGDFINETITMNKEQNYSISIAQGYASNGPWKECFRIYIDLNQDDDFDDAGELIFENTPSSNGSDVVGSIVIPSTATNGLTRIRVIMRYNQYQDQCGSFQYGEVEDYTVDIKGDNSGDDLAPDMIRDIDGNDYHTVKIGKQVWTVENLHTEHYNDGTPIENITDVSAWKSTTSGAYCYYDNISSNKGKYGALYNWYAVNTGKLAPEGWHVPTEADWEELENYLINHGYNWDGSSEVNKIHKAMAAKTRWNPKETEGQIGHDMEWNNRSGFSGLPGGWRISGEFGFIGDATWWWSTTEFDELSAHCCDLEFAQFKRIRLEKNFGISVRLLKD